MAKNPLGSDPTQDDERLARPGAPTNGSQSHKEPFVTGERSPDTSTYLSANGGAGNGKTERGEEAGDERASIRAMSEMEMEEFLRNEFITGQILPSCPPINGFHTCWLSTTNQYDTIPYRMRLGYTPVTLEEIPEFRSTQVRTGEYSGMIGVNEMLLFKIPESAYQKIMNIMHHERPMQEEERLRANIDLIEGGKDSAGKSLLREIGDGTEEMLKRSPGRAPQHWEG